MNDALDLYNFAFSSAGSGFQILGRVFEIKHVAMSVRRYFVLIMISSFFEI